MISETARRLGPRWLLLTALLTGAWGSVALAAPEAPKAPKAPEAPEAPEAPKAPEAPEAPDPAVKAALEAVSAAYRGIKTIRVDLEQTSSGPSYFEPLVQEGSFVVQRPDRVRWELRGAGGTNTWISDGTTLWVVRPAEKTVQVFHHVAPGIRRYIGFLSGLDGVQEEFRVSVQSEGPEAVPDRTVLKLSPRQRDEQLQAIYVQLDSTSHVVGVVMISPFGDRTDMQLRGLKLNAPAPEALFRWDPQPGWHVVPMD